MPGSPTFGGANLVVSAAELALVAEAGAMLAAEVPEPATVLLLGSGVLGFKRRQR